MTLTVDNEPMFHVEFPQSVQSETLSRKRSTSETIKSSSTRPPRKSVTVKQVTRVIWKWEFSFDHYVPQVRKIPRCVCTYYMEGRCKCEDTYRYNHNFSHGMERLVDPVSVNHTERRTLNDRINLTQRVHTQDCNRLYF
jgi:hypothetical protein